MSRNEELWRLAECLHIKQTAVHCFYILHNKLISELSLFLCVTTFLHLACDPTLLLSLNKRDHSGVNQADDLSSKLFHWCMFISNGKRSLDAFHHQG